MEPGLAARHPEIKTYSGRGLDRPATTIRLDLSPLGLHASVRGPEGMWYVDPTEPRDPAVYRSYFGRDVVDNPHGLMAETGAEIPEISSDRGYYHAVDTVTLHGAGFAPLAPIAVTISASEGTPGSRTVDAVADAQGAFDVSFVADPDESLGTHLVEASDGQSSASSGYDVVTAEDRSVDPPVGDLLRTYRLALLTDPTYADYFGADNVTAAKVSLINRVTHVYEAETAIRLVLIAGNDALNLNTPAQMTGLNGPCGGAACFTPAQAVSCAGGTLARERQVIGLLAGASNFDIGHLALGLDAGGMSSLGVVGGNNKAMGCTGIATPVGDLFAVGLVAHEMGHQFSANHSYNGTLAGCATGVRNFATSVEPGSGSSIMGLRGPVRGGRPPGPLGSLLVAAQLRRDHELRRRRRSEHQRRPARRPDRLRRDGLLPDPLQRQRLRAHHARTELHGRGHPGRHPGDRGLARLRHRQHHPRSRHVLPDHDRRLAVPHGREPAGDRELQRLHRLRRRGGEGRPHHAPGTVTPTGNAYPLVTAPVQLTIPLRTPFALTGSATDADGDPLTYTWEQNDRGGPMGTTLLNNTKTNGPLFRQFGDGGRRPTRTRSNTRRRGRTCPGPSPTRVFPDLAQILANDTNAESGDVSGRSTWSASRSSCPPPRTSARRA